MNMRRHEVRWSRGRAARQPARWRRAVRVPLALLCLGGLGSCGGGGGSGSATIGSLPSSSFETQEYSSSYGLGAIHASSAYAEGATGQGVIVAVIDTGIDVDHPEFAGAIHPDSTDIVTDDPQFLDDQDGHGTAVAGVIGARRNGALTHGVAYQSRLLAVRADAIGSCGTMAGCAFTPADVANATDHAVDHNADVINYSLGGASVLDPILEDALERAVDGGVTLVLAAGNEGALEPTFPARFAADA
jgi:subtilisin family serine protease